MTEILHTLRLGFPWESSSISVEVGCLGGKGVLREC